MQSLQALPGAYAFSNVAVEAFEDRRLRFLCRVDSPVRVSGVAGSSGVFVLVEGVLVLILDLVITREHQRPSLGVFLVYGK